jgi:hypothetical protein
MIPGDSNHDGEFNSSDLVLVFQAGEYEDALPSNSTFEEGDWDGDGDFTTHYIVFVFQQGNYLAAAQLVSPDRTFFARWDDPVKRRQRGALVALEDCMGEIQISDKSPRVESKTCGDVPEDGCFGASVAAIEVWNREESVGFSRPSRGGPSRSGRDGARRRLFPAAVFHKASRKAAPLSARGLSSRWIGHLRAGWAMPRR